MKLNPLRGSQGYLSGPIEHDAPGHNWRVEPTRILTERFGINVFDPFADPKQLWVPDLNKARAEKDHASMVRIARDFVRKDLSEVDHSHMIIAYLPYQVPTTGTVHEIINGNNAKKPTLLVSDQNDISYIPLWWFGFIPIEFMFPNWDSLYDYLESVNQGNHRSNNRWSRVYGDI